MLAKSEIYAYTAQGTKASIPVLCGDSDSQRRVLQFFSKSKDQDDLDIGVNDWRKILSIFSPHIIEIDGEKYPSIGSAHYAAKARCSGKPEMAQAFEVGGKVGATAEAAKAADSTKNYKEIGAKLDGACFL